MSCVVPYIHVAYFTPDTLYLLIFHSCISPPHPISPLVTTSLFSQRRQWHPTPVLLPGKSHGQRSLVGCSPWGREESGTTERLHFHFSLSCIGEGNGNSPLQCSCLENPRDGEPGGLPLWGRTGWTRLSDSAAAAVCPLCLFSIAMCLYLVVCCIC